MRLLHLLLLMSLYLPATAEVRVDAHAEPDGDIYLGQRVRLVVDVRTDTWFTTAPRYRELKLPGVIALLPEEFGINFTEREGGTTWAGQLQRYVLFPQRVGKLAIPPIEVALAVSVDGRPGEVQVVATPAVTINVIAPPGAADVPAFVTTPRLTVSEDWDRHFEDLKVGDAITRTITQRADDVFALVLPGIDFVDIESLGVYPATPDLDDRAERGQYSATRIDRVTYVLESDGEFTLPAIAIHWFDPERRRMVTETLDAVEFDVAPNPDAVLGEAPIEAEQPSYDFEAVVLGALNWLARNIHWLTLLAAAVYVLHRLWRHFVPAWIESWRDARERRRNSEARYFRELISALRSNDTDRIVAAFWRWADRLPGREPPLSLDALVAQALDTGFAETWRGLEIGRYGRSGAASGRLSTPATKELRALRRNWLHCQSQLKRSPQAAVPPERLNP